MGFPGPAPKDPSKRARGARGEEWRVVRAEVAPQPDLPDLMVWDSGKVVGIDWPDVTREWWQMWADSPLSDGFTATDWSELRDTARLHALYWLGSKDVAGELRQRTAKFGATPEDRAKLRIVLADADEKELKRPGTSAAADRYDGLKAV